MTRSAAPFARAGDEPALADLLADPILHALMRRDRLTEGDLRTAIERARAALRMSGYGNLYASFTHSRLDP
ncbi:hypothetical protein A6A04_16260 [Paramagnetospirillum marisnigri]|uniref:Uncharacterized protein n=1 Tax=Paramagnetospirillum marisnigri TaxID=1285242 RepID=A0A178MQJ3_9PROT|nr:hypothetical protein A6A04_16260 [Paramagnetospirillum marisnigri]